MRELKRPDGMPYLDFLKHEFSDPDGYVVLCEVDGDNEKFLMRVFPYKENFAIQDDFAMRRWKITSTTLVPKIIFESWEEVKNYFEEIIRKSPISAWRDKYEKYVDHATAHMQ